MTLPYTLRAHAMPAGYTHTPLPHCMFACCVYTHFYLLLSSPSAMPTTSSTISYHTLPYFARTHTSGFGIYNIHTHFHTPPLTVHHPLFLLHYHPHTTTTFSLSPHPLLFLSSPLQVGKGWLDRYKLDKGPLRCTSPSTPPFYTALFVSSPHTSPSPTAFACQFSFSSAPLPAVLCWRRQAGIALPTSLPRTHTHAPFTPHTTPPPLSQFSSSLHTPLPSPPAMHSFLPHACTHLPTPYCAIPFISGHPGQI